MFGGDDDEEDEVSPEQKPERISELIEAVPPEAEEEATEFVRTVDDADEAIKGLEQIIAENSPDSPDEAVRQAETLDGLERLLATDGSITSWVGSRVGMIKGSESAQLREVLAEFPDRIQAKADEIVEEGESAEEVINNLETLTEEFHEQRSDDIVAEAESLEDLKSSLGNDESQEESDEGRSLLGKIRNKTDEGIEETQHTFENAEPHEAATWGLMAGLAVMNPALGAPAVAASTSTSALVAASALGGGAIGAYASSHNDSALNDVDPTELLNQSQQMAEKGRDIEDIDGETLGAALGASSYLADILVPEAYAQWVTHADPEAMLEGASLGAQHAAANEVGISRRQGKTVGAGLGLMIGYARSGESDDALQEVLDADLFKEYQDQVRVLEE
ncbi:AAA family ATPase [Halorussus marinus]|uniref:hypothetical protein n=1 Tax=Halorussus marinus TaxID=2505976 RepID=UPI001091D5A9|nr:hypothetical protein [Halorussus marinus]